MKHIGKYMYVILSVKFEKNMRERETGRERKSEREREREREIDR